MTKLLNQEEIDALFSSAQQSRKAGMTESRRKIEKCDLGRSNILTADQVRAVTTLHEALARRLGSSLSAYLRVGFEMNLVSAEQLSYGEFLGRMPELTYLASLRILPLDARAIVQADLSLVFPIVDLVLGGSGADLIEPRDLTEIEEEIFQTVASLIASDLQITWAPLIALDIQFDQRQQLRQAQHLMLANEKTLSLSFEIRLPEARGTLSMAIPAVVANALLRKLSSQSLLERVPSRDTREKIRECTLDSRFEATLSLPDSPLSVRALLALEPGSVLILPKRADESIHLNIAGKPMFFAYPVRHGTQKGARVDRRVSIAAPRGKESK
jgi:flagellar motor switch protein FliM